MAVSGGSQQQADSSCEAASVSGVGIGRSRSSLFVGEVAEERRTGICRLHPIEEFMYRGR